MSGSGDASANDYARAVEPAPTAMATEPVRRFRPRWLPTLAAALLVPLFIAAGQWQWDKAAAKAARQQQLEVRAGEPAVQIPAGPADAQALQYRRIAVRGHYEPQHQILIDNRTYRQQAGFHVVTPLRVEGSDIRLLVNRGWIPALAEHSRAPEVATPPGFVEVSGVAIIPASRFFTLQADNGEMGGTWQRVWQNLDLARYGEHVNFRVQPVVMQLDPASAAGGFVRDWVRPDDRRLTNLSYAFQWWGFAATTIALWCYFGFRRTF